MLFCIILFPKISEAKGIDLHKTNYIGYGYVKDIDHTNGFNNYEASFQYSLKVPIIHEKNSLLFVAFSQKSFWQLGNTKASSPVHESNYQPEVFLESRLTNSVVAKFGYRHQSNGLSGKDSRSWERIFSSIGHQNSLYFWNAETWYSFGMSDNPDINNYLPYWNLELGVNYYDSEVSVSGGYNWDKKKGNITLELSHPLTKEIALYVQVNEGYGESLINYDSHNSRVTLGFRLLPNFNR
nr:phospholipase A [Vibrio sp. 99-70-13A1]